MKIRLAIGAGFLLVSTAAPASAAAISCPRADPDDVSVFGTPTPTPTPGTGDCVAQIPGGAVRLKGGRWIGSAPLADGRGSYRFDERGQLLRATDALGRTVIARPTARLLTLTDVDGVATQFEYNALGQLRRVAGPSGALASFAYDTSGRIVSIVTADGTTAYAYDAAYRLMTVATPGAAATNITYGGGRIVVIADGAGLTSLSYDARGDLVHVSEPAHTVAYAYDAIGQLIRVVVDGAVTEYSYDAGRLLRIGNASGTTTYSYDSAGRLVRVVDPSGAVTTYSYDRSRISTTVAPNGSVTRYSYDLAGRLTATSASSGVTSYSYDAAGNLASIVDVASGATTFLYGVGSLRVICPSDEATEPASLRPPVPSPTTADCAVGFAGTRARVSDGWWWAEGRLDGAGAYRYDDSGRIFEVADASGNATPLGTDDRLIQVVDFAGRITSFAYDSFGRLTAAFGAAGTLDSHAYAGASGKINSSSDSFGAVTRFAYDALGRLTGVVQASGAPMALAYGASGIVTVGDVTGATALTYSSNDDLLHVSGLSQTVSYAYEPPGRVALVIDPAGNTTHYFYADGRLLRSDSTSGLTDYSYDAFGNLTSVTNPRGAVARYSYDEGRLATEITPIGSRIEYSYSESGQLVEVADNSKGITRYSYDAAGRTTSITDRLSSSDESDLRTDVTLLNERLPVADRGQRGCRAEGGDDRAREVPAHRPECRDR